MPTYQPMSCHLETERLTLRPWTESDADDVRALHAERGNGTPTVEDTRELIARHHGSADGARRAEADLGDRAFLERAVVWSPRETPIERGHVSTDDRGELVWLPRALP